MAFSFCEFVLCFGLIDYGVGYVLVVASVLTGCVLEYVFLGGFALDYLLVCVLLCVFGILGGLLVVTLLICCLLYYG